MRTKNHCQWLVIGTTETCGKNCVGDYCHIHNARFKKFPNTNKPCIHCGRGTKNELGICHLCGFHKIYNKLAMRRFRARKKAEKDKQISI